MFVRSCWRPQAREEVYDLIDAHPWALLVTNGEAGPLATNLPLLVDRGRGAHGVLVGHLARANAHAHALFAAREPSLAVFEGPWGYVTPTWYPNRDMPGTYYYTAVHCYGRLSEQSTAQLEASLAVLNDRMEAPLPDGWRMDEIPHTEITRRLPAIVGFELEIERLEAKFKLGQDEPLADALAVADHLVASPDAGRRALGEAVRRANAGRPERGTA